MDEITRKVEEMLEKGVKVEKISHLVQVGWVNRDHPNVFAGITQLSVLNIGDRPLKTQRDDWIPIYRIDQ